MGGGARFVYTCTVNRAAQTQLTVILALVIISALVFGGVMHSIIPHNHSAHITHESGESDKESPVWVSLHSALRHEDKKLLFVLLILLSFALAQVVRIRAAHFPPLYRGCAYASMAFTLRPLHFSTGRWITRGISPYRRFG